MKILNYNKTDHDIYTFAGEENIVVCAIPTSDYESLPGVRRHATITGWNDAGLWNNDIDGSGVPDWSGLSARTRGSNLYSNPGPNSFFNNFSGDFELWTEGSSDPRFSDLTNWNNGIPPHIIISKNHFIGCAHYNGTNPTQTFNILNRDGVMYSITGTLISINFNDTYVYRITSITGGSIPPATEINETHKIKIYQILNLRGKQNMDGLRIWHQDNNGKFITTTRINGIINPAFARNGQPTAPSESSGLPILVSIGYYWVGDSGSPILATYEGETYVIGIGFSTINRDLSDPVMFNFLYQLLLSDTITPVAIDLFDPTPPELYSCDTSTGNCSPSINGTWVNKDDCDAACDIIVTNRVDCITGQCTVTNPTGAFATIQECQSSLTCPPPTQQNSASLNYDVWAAAFSGSQWITPSHPWMTEDYRFHSVVPMAQMEGMTNNGHRTAPTTPNSFAYNRLKDRLSTIPKGRRVLLNWYTINDVSPYRKLENDYYKNTLDGFFYKGATFLSVWQDKGSNDAGQELTRIFGLLNSDQIDFDYIFDDHEAEPGLYGMEGQNAYPLRDSSGNIVSLYGDIGVLPDARVFGAIISDPRFVTVTNRFTSRSFSEDFLDFYKQLSKQPNTTLTTSQLLRPWLRVETATEFHTPSDSPAINPITSRPYSDERDFMISAWQGSYYLHLKYAYWGETTNNSLSNFSRYADVIMSNYESCPISIEEAEYARNSNNIRTFIPPLSNTTIASGGHAMFGIPLNIIYAYWTDPAVPSTSTGFNGNSGYVRNPETDIDRYNWAYYLINPSTIPATVDFKKYAETISIPDFLSKRAHKQLINDVKFMRHILRSDPLWWQQNVPNISYPRNHYYDGPNHNDWHELVYHVILHGLLYIMYFSESYVPSDVKLLHDALVEWKRISNNSSVKPCSRVDGNVSSNATPVDRVLLHDAVENILISGGKSLKSGKYIWRLTAPPSMRVGNFIYFRRLSSETDLTLPETIIVDCSVEINGRGAWIVRDVQGMPKYESYISTTPPPSSWDCINGICTEFLDLSHPYASLDECSQNCSIPPTVTYDCIDGTCEQVFGDPVGTYPNLLSCTSACRVREINTWECIGGQCQEITGPSGRYTTEEECLGSDCGNEVPVTTYNCVSGVCDPIDGPDGTYQTLPNCTNSGCGIIIPPTPPNITNKILENPQFIDLTKSIPTTPLSVYPYNSR